MIAVKDSAPPRILSRAAAAAATGAPEAAAVTMHLEEAHTQTESPRLGRWGAAADAALPQDPGRA